MTPNVLRAIVETLLLLAGGMDGGCCASCIWSGERNTSHP